VLPARFTGAERCFLVSADMLSDKLKAFIHSSVKSILALELLLFLRAKADRSWTISALVRELRASEPIVKANLGSFQAAGLIREEGAGWVRFAPASPDLDDLVREIADIYATRPVEVSEEIYAVDRAIQHFADAFRLKKE
jgi:predicted DNA-binding transcriptional regulator